MNEGRMKAQTKQTNTTTTTMADEDATLQTDELESLSMIYEDEFAWDHKASSDNAHDTHTCKITVGSDKFELRLLIPRDYPSKSPPLYELDQRWTGRPEAAQIRAILDSAFNPGDVVIMDWVEALREFLEEAKLEAEAEKEHQQQQQQQQQMQERQDQMQQQKEDEDSSANVHGDEENTNTSSTSDPAHPCPHIDHGEPFTDRKSTFQGHVATVHSVADVKAVMAELLSNSKIARATHNMVAYRIWDDDRGVWVQDCDDDGEHGASSRMLHVLQLTDARNVLVVVSRWFGGILLGPDRFKHINNCTRDVMVEFGHIQDSSSSSDSGGKRKKKGRKKR
ncbi:hypothetical protein PTSG_12741 [Salpingoeca rosetta]|uniref:RWD domain-containing protein n=1 Tax=Salpingoeca rosetta (strain ATCC 50818 / BSB-021) TaxID=946362 RepID=F2UJV7_SALR5|nr:uncharacterized protein PTSG_12741 [Salpingoeca rosetta]EGD77406.1 hypothetical protein PTSG_12741 [Salpingoeca rosetta]|eukprot:XP_004990750.1 hypothetical protein PTSG_12741 [Salpingoeca rosetta]